MALLGAGGTGNGWASPLYLTSASYPITIAGWFNVPTGIGGSSTLFGLTSANASIITQYNFYNTPPLLYTAVVDDTGAGATSGAPGAFMTADSNWHHLAVWIGGNGVGVRMWLDGVLVNADTSLAVGAQTLTQVALGVAPTNANFGGFDSGTALAEVVLFNAGAGTANLQETILRLAEGANPLRVPGAQNMRAYFPLRNSLQNPVGQRIGLRPLGTPGNPIWTKHPNVDAPTIFRRSQATHAPIFFLGTSASTNSGTGTLSTSILPVGTSASANSATGSILASSLQSSTTLNRNSAIGSLFAATHLTATGSSANTALGAFSGIAIPFVGTSTSSNASIGSLTIPGVAANAAQLQNALIDSIMRGQPLQAPSVWFIALVTQLGTPLTPGVEVTGGSYARSAVPASLTAWSGTQGPSTTSQSIGLSGLISNNAAISFPTASADWSTVVGYEFWDQPLGGNRWLSGKLGTALTIHNGDTRAFPISSLSVAIG